MSNLLSYVLMLDVSGSMWNVVEQVKINAHAFVGWSRVGDQFGINSFSDDAVWVYPKDDNPNILTVSPSFSEVENAFGPIQGITARNMTNIGDAIRLGNNMIAKATPANIKAFVLLSDGMHNMGQHPREVLGNTPPLYVAALGCTQESYFSELIQKNPKSKYYFKPDAYQMTLMFNDIVSDTTDSALLMNTLTNMRKGASYEFKKFNVSRGGSEVFLQLVWNSAAFKYTPEDKNIQKNQFRVSIYNPQNERITATPDVIHDGYCVFRLNCDPGTWTVSTEYSIDEENPKCTFGGINYSVAVRASIDAPLSSKAGEPVKLATTVLDGKAIVEKDITVTARIERPTISVANALNKYEAELGKMELKNDVPGDDVNLAKLNMLRNQKLHVGDILARKASVEMLSISKDGTYDLVINDATEPGIYEVIVTAEGKDPQTGNAFTDIENHTFIVE